jgi:hypothetical protein
VRELGLLLTDTLHTQESYELRWCQRYYASKISVVRFRRTATGSGKPILASLPVLKLAWFGVPRRPPDMGLGDPERGFPVTFRDEGVNRLPASALVESRLYVFDRDISCKQREGYSVRPIKSWSEPQK